MKVPQFAFLSTSFLLIFGTSSYARNAEIENAFNAKIRAQNEYYQAVKNMKNPTPEQLQDLKNSILVPAQKGMKDAIKKSAKDDAEKFKKDQEAMMNSSIQSIESFIEQTGKKPEDKSHARQVMKDAMKNDFSRVGIKKNRPSPSPTLKGAAQGKDGAPSKEVQAAPLREDFKLDGSKIPHQIEFSGKKSPKIQPQTKPSVVPTGR